MIAVGARSVPRFRSEAVQALYLHYTGRLRERKATASTTKRQRGPRWVRAKATRAASFTLWR
jgi:hypothetical protein